MEALAQTAPTSPKAQIDPGPWHMEWWTTQQLVNYVHRCEVHKFTDGEAYVQAKRELDSRNERRGL